MGDTPDQVEKQEPIEKKSAQEQSPLTTRDQVDKAALARLQETRKGKGDARDTGNAMAQGMRRDRVERTKAGEGKDARRGGDRTDASEIFKPSQQRILELAGVDVNALSREDGERIAKATDVAQRAAAANVGDTQQMRGLSKVTFNIESSENAGGRGMRFEVKTKEFEFQILTRTLADGTQVSGMRLRDRQGTIEASHTIPRGPVIQREREKPVDEKFIDLLTYTTDWKRVRQGREQEQRRDAVPQLAKDLEKAIEDKTGRDASVTWQPRNGDVQRPIVEFWVDTTVKQKHTRFMRHHGELVEWEKTVDVHELLGAIALKDGHWMDPKEVHNYPERGVESVGLGPIGTVLDLVDSIFVAKALVKWAAKGIVRIGSREGAEILSREAAKRLERRADSSLRRKALDRLRRDAADASARKAGNRTIVSPVRGPTKSIDYVDYSTPEGLAAVRSSHKLSRALQEAHAGVTGARQKAVEKIRKRGTEVASPGDRKPIYNRMEHRYVVEMQALYPERQFMEQVKIIGVRRSDGTITSTRDIAGKGRIPDWGEHTAEGKLVLGDIKSRTEFVHSVAGRTKRGSVIASFRTKSKIGEQHDVERSVISYAQRKNGMIVVEGRNPITGKTIKRDYAPGDVSLSKVTDYYGMPYN